MKQNERLNEPTAVRLMTTAVRLFAENGYNGTSVRQITREAGTNLGAVTYHFGGKRELYARALERALSPLADRVVARAGEEGSALERLERVVAGFFDFLEQRPELPQLVLQEAAAGRTPPEPVQRVLGVAFGALSRLIGEGQAAGEIRSGDPGLMAVSVVSQPLHLTLATRLVDEIDAGVLGRDELFSHAMSFIRWGLEAGSPAGE